jgi:predicted protein tyrosine phosphatase
MPNKTDSIFQLSAPYNNSYQGPTPRILFVCSAGLLRSPTGASLYNILGYNTRSCGSEDYALIPLSANLIEWAELIVFVNKYNYLGAQQTFKNLIPEWKCLVLDIEDDYNYNDPKLIQEFRKHHDAIKQRFPTFQ